MVRTVPFVCFFFFKAEDGIRDIGVTGVSDVCSSDLQRVARIVENVDNFPQALGESRQPIESPFRNADSLVTRLNETAPKLDAAVSDISNLARADRKSVV